MSSLEKTCWVSIYKGHPVYLHIKKIGNFIIWFLMITMKWVFLLSFSINFIYSLKQNSCIPEFRNFLRKYNLEEENNCNYLEKKTWNYYVNITKENQLKTLEARNSIDKFKRWVWNETRVFNTSCLKDGPSLQRQFVAIVRDVGISVLSEDKVKQLHFLTTKMEENIAKEAINVEFKNFTSYYEKKAYQWWLWKKTVGKSNYLLYHKSIKLWNESCQLHGFTDCSEYWHSFYEDSDFISSVKSVWKQVKPLYLQLHAYVRRKLIEIHGEKIDSKGPIPTYFLGSKFASNWRNIFNLTLPYPKKRPKDFSENLIRKKLNSTGLFKLCETYFTSLGFSNMSSEFWKKSLFEKPVNSKSICYPSAWDFCDRKDFRIQQCTEINQKNFITAHHEMGHIHYFMNYAHLPITFRAGANPGFHEAIGDVIGLSVMSNNYFDRHFDSSDVETTLNFLYMMALEKVSILPFSMLVDMWRWGLYVGKIDVKNMNKLWWDMRLEYQGINSPFRISEDDFELGSIIQVIKNIDYIRYFVSGIIQFQFYEGLCQAAGHNGLLLNCNIYGSKAAGSKLREALRLGASRPWPEVMHIITERKYRKMNANSLLNYFQPLHEWLKVKNQQEKIGWSDKN